MCDILNRKNTVKNRPDVTRIPMRSEQRDKWGGDKGARDI